MRCPNPDCPFVKKRGRAAEYRTGIAVCTDCGASLVDKAADVPATSTGFAAAVGRAGGAPALPWPRHVVTALAITAAAALGPLALAFVPLPYIERDALLYSLGEGTSRWDLSSVSVGALGVVPWLTAALVVEIVAVLVPRLRRLRHAGPNARASLDRAGFVLGVFFALAQSWMLVARLAGADAAFYDSVAPELWALGPKLVVIGTLVGGACLARLAAVVIDRSGVGNGLVLVTSAALIVDVARELIRQAVLVREDVLTPFQIVVTLAMFAVPFVAAWRLVQVRATPLSMPANPANAAFVVRPSAGIVPATFAFVVPSLAVTVAALANVAPPSTAVTTIAGALVAAALVPLCSSVWASRERVARFLAIAATPADGRATADAAAHEQQARAEVADAQAPTWILNGVVVGVVAVAVLWLPYGFINVVAVVVLAATARDIEVEVRARRASSVPLTSVGALHRLDLVNPLLHLLAREKIDATLRGAHARALSHFFAPWIPIEIFVDASDEANVERARSIVRAVIAQCVETDPPQLPS